MRCLQREDILCLNVKIVKKCKYLHRKQGGSAARKEFRIRFDRRKPQHTGIGVTYALNQFICPGAADPADSRFFFYDVFYFCRPCSQQRIVSLVPAVSRHFLQMNKEVGNHVICQVPVCVFSEFLRIIFPACVVKDKMFGVMEFRFNGAGF